MRCLQMTMVQLSTGKPWFLNLVHPHKANCLKMRGGGGRGSQACTQEDCNTTLGACHMTRWAKDLTRR